MNYLQKPKYHYRPEMGWINDPNGLVFYKGYYHVFYQHAPDSETPWQTPMHWGHARTKDFLEWEELPVALYPDREYDRAGCWSGTAMVRGERLYLFYASVHTPDGSEDKVQTVSVAYSDDGIHFKKYAGNPVIDSYPEDGCPDFRDPAVCCVNGEYYCVMATGHHATQTARLLLYRSEDLFSWEYMGVMCQWERGVFAECPSFIVDDRLSLLAASVCSIDAEHYFSVMFGSFMDGEFKSLYSGQPDRGPDQYAGQVFRDHMGRNILISWIPGWQYAGFAERDIGCMSVPREIRLENGRVLAWPVEEVQHLLRDDDPCIERTDHGFIIRREGRSHVEHRGEVRELKVLRDGYIAEVFVNGGEQVYSVLL